MFLWIAHGGALVVCASDFQGASHTMAIDEAPFNYSKAEPQNALSELRKKVADGAVKLAWDAEYGYLPALLEALQVPVSSQMLVFSKTSMQRDRISPQNPRALYFNDDVYVGWIPGAPLMEVSIADPKLGGVFYSLEQKKVE